MFFNFSSSRHGRGIAAIQREVGFSAYLAYREPGGSEAERDIAARWLRSRIADAHGDRLVICPGTQNALFNFLIGRLSPGDVVLTEALTYPGVKQITAPGACTAVVGPSGTITIDVPIADVSLDAGVAPFANRLYSVTASTMTLNAPPESVPPDPGNFHAFTGPMGGVLFDVIDVARAYDVALQ